MELYDQSHYEDVRWIIQRPDKPHYNYEAIMHPNRKGEVLMERVESIDWRMDFVGNYTTHISAVLVMDYRTYYTQIWPVRNNLECTLIKHEGSECEGTTITQYTHRYRCILPEEVGKSLDAEVVHSMEKTDMLLTEYHVIQVQLVELFSEPTPYVYTEGIYIDEDREEFLRGTISHALDNIKDAPKFDHLYIDPKWDNRRRLERALIPTHTRMNNIPFMLQKDFGGFYNHGIGSYHMNWGGTHYRECPPGKKNIWFIYPLMDVTRWHRTLNHDKLIMWVVPDTNEAWDDYNHTYHPYPPKHRHCHPDGPPPVDHCPLIMNIYVRRMKANAEALEGRSTVKPYAYNTKYPKEMMDVPIDIDAKGVWGSGDRLSKNVEFASRKDGINDFPSHYKEDTVNYQVAATLMAQNIGKRMDFTWNHSDHELIMPGMPVRMHWELNKVTTTVYGIILFAHSIILNAGKINDESAKHDSKTYLSVYVLRPEHEL